jgi:transcriptional regulator with XRE-family HTH domain
MSFGNNLQALREAAGLSQSELAEKSGISVKTIQNWEIDRNSPRMDALVRLAHALGTTLDMLVIHRHKGQAKTKRRRGRPRKEK